MFINNGHINTNIAPILYISPSKHIVTAYPNAPAVRPLFSMKAS